MSSSNQNNTPLQHHHILRNAGIALVLCVLIVVIVLKVTEDPEEITKKPKDTEKPKGTTTSAPSEDKDTGDNDGGDTPGDGDTDKDKTDEDKTKEGEDTSPPLPDDYFTDSKARLIYILGATCFVFSGVLAAFAMSGLKRDDFIYRNAVSIIGFVLLGLLITIPILISTFKSSIQFWIGYLIFMILLFMSGGRIRNRLTKGTFFRRAFIRIADFIPYLLEGIQGLEFEAKKATNEAEKQIKRGTVENRINTFENNEE